MGSNSRECILHAKEYRVKAGFVGEIGRWGNYEMDDMNLEAKISLWKGRGRSEASTHRLSLGLVRKAPRASLRAEV